MAKTKKQTPEESALVAGYLRVSTEEQAESGLGLDAQRRLIRAQAVLDGWEPDEVAWYVDEGVSGTIDITEREEGLRLVQDIHAGKVKAVIVSAIDRIGRRALYILGFVDDIEKKNCQFASCKEHIDTTTIQGKFVLQMFAAIAELERNTIAQRTQQALEARGRTVGIKAGQPPFGYRYEGKEVLIVPVEAEVVRQVYELRAQGLTLRAIATHVPLSFNAVKNVLDREAAYRGSKRGESAETWPVILENAA